MHGIQALHHKSSTFLHEELFFLFAEFFNQILKHELYQTKRVSERKQKNQLTSLIEFVVFPLRVFHELFKLCKIETPVSSAACECSFLASWSKTISEQQWGMKDNHLGVLSIESRWAQSLNMDKFVRDFSSNHKNCRILLFLNLPGTYICYKPHFTLSAIN